MEGHTQIEGLVDWTVRGINEKMGTYLKMNRWTHGKLMDI